MLALSACRTRAQSGAVNKYTPNSAGRAGICHIPDNSLPGPTKSKTAATLNPKPHNSMATRAPAASAWLPAVKCTMLLCTIPCRAMSARAIKVRYMAH